MLHVNTHAGVQTCTSQRRLWSPTGMTVIGFPPVRVVVCDGWVMVTPKTRTPVISQEARRRSARECQLDVAKKFAVAKTHENVANSRRSDSSVNVSNTITSKSASTRIPRPQLSTYSCRNAAESWSSRTICPAVASGQACGGICLTIRITSAPYVLPDRRHTETWVGCTPWIPRRAASRNVLQRGGDGVCRAASRRWPRRMPGEIKEEVDQPQVMTLCTPGLYAMPRPESPQAAASHNVVC